VESVKGGEQSATLPQRPSTELPPDVRTKLRKLEKLEARYQGTDHSVCDPHALIVFRAPAVISNSTCASSFHRAIRKGTEREHTFGDYLGPRCVGGVSESA